MLPLVVVMMGLRPGRLFDGLREADDDGDLNNLPGHERDRGRDDWLR